MSNSTCQADEFKMISTVGPILQKTWEYVGSVLIETGFWGAYVILFSFAVYIQRTKGFKSNRSRLVMFLVTCTLFINCTILWIIDLTSLQLYGRILMQGFENRDPDFSSSKFDSELQSKVSALEEITSRLKPWGIVQENLFLINLILSDAIVVWRTHVICERKRFITAIPVFCLFITAVFSIISLICSEGAFCTEAQLLPSDLSVITNLVSTALIAFKTWSIRKWIKKSLGYLPAKTRAQKMLTLLVESGVIYCIFWAIIVFFVNMPMRSLLVNPMTKSLVGLQTLGSAQIRLSYLLYALTAVRNQLTGIYPTAIIVLAAVGQTFEYMFEDITLAHSAHINNPEITQVSSVITFAPRNTESTMTMGVSTATSQSIETRASSTTTGLNS